jgi:O-antigen/teichoic acid export membrane protein
MDKKWLLSISTLISGNSLAYLILFLGSIPILRLYSPEVYGRFATIQSMAALLTILSTGQMHHGLYIETDPVKRNGIFSYIAQFYVVSILLSLIGIWIYTVYNDQDQVVSLFFIPVFITLGAAQAVLLVLATQKEFFKKMAGYRLISALLFVSIALLAGIKSSGLTQLLLAHSLAYTVGLIYLGIGWISPGQFRLKNIWPLSRSTTDFLPSFVKFTLPSEFLNNVASQLPLLFMSQIHGAEAAGHFKLATKILQVPLESVGNALGTVFRQEASKEIRMVGTAQTSFLRTSLALVVSGFVIYLLIAISSVNLIPLIWGIEWKNTVVILFILTGFYLARYIVSPLSYIGQLSGHQKEMFFLVLGYSFSIMIWIAWAYAAQSSVHTSLIGLTIVYISIAVIHYVFALKFSKESIKRI